MVVSFDLCLIIFTLASGYEVFVALLTLTVSKAGIPICPGRLISKNVILHTTAFMVKNVDVELLTPKLDISNWRYGLGVGRPAHIIPARIRKRSEKSG